MKDSLDVKYEEIERLKEKTFSAEGKMKSLFSEYIKTQDDNKLDEVVECLVREDISRTADMKKMASIVYIIKLEKARYERCFLTQNTDDYNDLYQKYVYTTLMLRRIEQEAEGFFALTAYEWINGISIEAILEIVKSEYFERRVYILEKIYEHMISNKEDIEKVEWLLAVTEKYNSQKLLMELSSIYLKYGDAQNAISFLNKIENKSDEIIEILNEIKSGV